jgi:hypothetical protein
MVSEPVQLDKVTASDFIPLVDSTFQIRWLNSPPHQWILNSVQELGNEVSGKRRAFSLLFSGPREPILAQGVYPLEHDSLGTLEIFVVPIGVTQDNCQYQVIFA